jgi:hypothetical protein
MYSSAKFIRRSCCSNVWITNWTFHSPEGQYPFWTTDISRRDIFIAGSNVDILVIPELPETSVEDRIPLDHSPITTAYLFTSSDTPSIDPNLTIPLHMSHFTMVPNDTIIPTKTMVASQAPIGTPLSPRPYPSLPPRYNALNSSISIPTHVPSREYGVFSPSRHNPVASFILTLPQPPSRGSYPPFMKDPSLVALLSISHLIIIFLLENNSTLGANLNPLLEVKSQLVQKLQLEENPHPPHPMDITYQQLWPIIGIFLPRLILNRLGGYILKSSLSYPLV